MFLRAVRFRFYQQHSDIQWAVENFYIGPACDAHCGGHGDCLDQRCLCDPGFTGPNCYASTALKVPDVNLISHILTHTQVTHFHTHSGHPPPSSHTLMG